jgi:hypothetical protein
MPDDPSQKFFTRLRDLICVAYTQAEFGDVMLEEVDQNVFDYGGLAPNQAYDEKVMEAIRWANRFGGPKRVLWLATIVSQRRPERHDLAALAADIEAALEPATFPLELSAPLGAFDEGATTLADLTRDFRPLLRKTSYQKHDLPGRYHLSDSEGRRLAAVLALEANPKPEYLRWLSERITVEPPQVAFVSAQALTAAALRLSRDHLERVRAAAQSAGDRLDGLAELDDQAAVGFDPAARKRQLQSALSLVEIRTRKGKSLLPPAEFDTFVGGLSSAFDVDGFDQLCRDRLQTSLKRLANLMDPLELIIINVVLTAREKGWERDLIVAAYQERPNDAALATIHQKYGAI